MTPKPVILGSSLTGLMISHSLSSKGIEHILIGGERPHIAPRLGESMNEGASLACWRFLGERYRKFFYPKSHISLFHGDLAMMLLLGNPTRCWKTIEQTLSDRSKRASVQSVINGLCHLDRSNFDPVFYDDVVSHDCCQFVRQPNAKVAFDHDTDRICRVQVGAHVIDQPGFVFDATGFRGVVAEAAGVGTQTISGLERVCWSHRVAAREPDANLHWWLNGTNLFRLDKTQDGIDGIAWMIPMGHRLSIGISTAANDPVGERLSKQELIGYLIERIQARGITIQQLFAKQDDTYELKHKYYVRRRGYGDNWMLAGGTFLQIWFPSSLGVSTSALAAELAPGMLQDPDRFGRLYERKLRSTLDFHQLLGGMVKGPAFRESDTAYDFFAAWTAGSFQRVHSDLQIANDEIGSRGFRYQWIKNTAIAFRRYPWLQVATVGSPFLGVRRIHQLGQSVNSFPDYFRYRRHLFRNAASGFVRYLSSKLARGLRLVPSRTAPPIARQTSRNLSANISETPSGLAKNRQAA